MKLTNNSFEVANLLPAANDLEKSAALDEAEGRFDSAAKKYAQAANIRVKIFALAKDDDAAKAELRKKNRFGRAWFSAFTKQAS